MTNEQRQVSLEKQRKVKGVECGQELYCKYCEITEKNCCAKAYNRMVRFKSNIREKYMWGD